VLAACFAATLLTPYHFLLYREILVYARQQDVSQYVTELYAPAFRHSGNYFLLVLALLAAYSLGRRDGVRPFAAMLLVSAAVLAFRSQRDAWLLALTSAYVIAGEGHEVPSRWYPASAMARASVALAVFVVIFAAAQLRHIDNTTLGREVARFFPVDAAGVIASHNYPGPLLNQYNWGGYLMWRLPNLPVSIDGRADLYRLKGIRHSVNLWNGEPGWQSDPELLHSRLIIGESNSPLCSLLRLDTRFELLYSDEVATVFRSRIQ